MQSPSLFDVDAALGPEGGGQSALEDMVGPLAQFRLRCTSRVGRRSIRVTRQVLRQAAMATLPPGAPHRYSHTWGPATREPVVCPAVFVRCLLHKSQRFDPDDARLLDVPLAGRSDPGRYEVMAGIDILAAMLARDPACVDSVDSTTGRTALHYAAVSNAPGVAQLLLEAGADANAEDPLDYTPVDVALCHRSVAVLATLVRRGGLGSCARHHYNRRDIQALLRPASQAQHDALAMRCLLLEQPKFAQSVGVPTAQNTGGCYSGIFLSRA